MTVALSPIAGAGWQFFDNSGLILSGGLLYIYSAGTTTPVTAYHGSAHQPHRNGLGWAHSV